MPPRPPTLDRALADLVRDLGDLGCRAAVPTSQGDLLLAFGGPPATQRVLVSVQARPVAPDAPPSVAGDLYVYEKGPAPPDRAWMEDLARRLVTLRVNGSAAWLDLHNRELGPLEPSPFGLWRCLAWQVEPGVPFFGPWALADVRFLGRERPGLRLVLSRPDEARDTRRLVIDPEARPREGEVPLAWTPLGLLSREAVAGGEQPVTATGGPEAALALILSLSVPPGIAWASPPVGDPPAPPASPDRPGREDESLIVHSYRTDHEWDDPRSRFFGTWGDRDWFILVALLDRPTPLVFHGNRECQQVRQPLSDRLVHGANPFTPARRSWSWLVRETHFTDTDDRAAVFGGEDRLSALLERLRAACPDREVRVLVGCDAEMVGDDVPRVCRAARQQGHEVECFNPPLPRFTDALDRNWWRVFLATRDRGVRGDPRAVNLAGYQWPGHPSLVEVEALLGAVGVRVATRFLPGQDPDIPSSVGAATVTLASPWHPVQDVLVGPLREEGLRVESPALPYGVHATRRWLDAVLALLGMPATADEVWDRAVRDAAPDLDDLRGRASGLRVALVADWGTVPEMVSPAFFYGLDPVRFLVDLGFRVALVGPLASQVTALVADLPGRGAAPVEALDVDRDAPDLIERVRDLAPDLVYCDRADPGGALGTGAVPFGIGDLEFGIGGARRTLRRLLARAGWSLHRRMAR